MHGWVVLATSVLSAEFPDFESLQAFNVFAAIQRRTGNVVGEEAVAQRKVLIERLVALLRLPPQSASALKKQIERHEPMARQIASTTGCSVMEAWRQTAQRRMKGAKAPPTLLSDALMRWFTYIPVTSGVESNFSKMMHTIRSQQQGMSHNAEMDIMKICLDWDPKSEGRLIDDARKCWSFLFGDFRTNRVTRVDAGLPKRKGAFDNEQSNNSEAAWIRARRCQVVRAASSSMAALPYVSGAGLGAVYAASISDRPARWTSEQEAELKFQSDKRDKRLIQALREGTLAPNDIDADLEHRNLLTMKKEHEGAKRREADARRVQTRTAPPVRYHVGELRVKSVWVQDKSLDDMALQLAIARVPMRRVELRHEAVDICVVGRSQSW